MLLKAQSLYGRSLETLVPVQSDREDHSPPMSALDNHSVQEACYIGEDGEDDTAPEEFEGQGGENEDMFAGFWRPNILY